MIQSFADKKTEMIWRGRRSSTLPQVIQQRAFNQLAMIHRSQDIHDLRVPPSNHFERLSGDRKGDCSIRINQQWRICVGWKAGHAYEVEITDYH